MTGPAPVPRVLVVDDSPVKIRLIRHVLGDSGAELVEARDGAEALQRAADGPWALLILDVDLPDLDGFELARRLGQAEVTRATPIIFITSAYLEPSHRARGYDSGAVDYLPDPIDPLALRAKVRVFLELHQVRRELEREVARREHEATHDPLTGLPNRPLFMDRLRSAFERARRQRVAGALLYVDIDGFKTVNDTHGHLAGDVLLQQIARRLEDGVRGADTVARLGGDEFAVLLEGPQEPGTARDKALKLCAALGVPYRLAVPGAGDIEARVGASIGLALFPDHAAGVDELIRAADAAMYRAKKAGKNRCEAAG